MLRVLNVREFVLRCRCRRRFCCWGRCRCRRNFFLDLIDIECLNINIAVPEADAHVRIRVVEGLRIFHLEIQCFGTVNLDLDIVFCLCDLDIVILTVIDGLAHVSFSDCVAAESEQTDIRAVADLDRICLSVERIHGVGCEEYVDKTAFVVKLCLKCVFFKCNLLTRHIEIVRASVVAVKCLVVNDPCAVDSGPVFKVGLEIVLEDLEIEGLGKLGYFYGSCCDCCLALLECADDCGSAISFDGGYRAVFNCPLNILCDVDRQQSNFHLQLVAGIHEVVFFIYRCNYQRNVTGFLLPDCVHRINCNVSSCVSALSHDLCSETVRRREYLVTSDCSVILREDFHDRLIHKDVHRNAAVIIRCNLLPVNFTEFSGNLDAGLAAVNRHCLICNVIHDIRRFVLANTKLEADLCGACARIEC